MTAARSRSAARRFQNSGGASYGPVNLVSALQVSSDVYFYTLGWKMWNTGACSSWAHMLGIGRPTGIDLPGAAESGLLPSKQWREPALQERR